jgi:undecaprenyl-diphosphatase
MRESPGRKWTDWAQWLRQRMVLVLERLSIAALAAVLFTGVFVWLAYVVARGSTRQLDLSLLAFFRTHQPDWLHVPLLAVTWLGNASTLIAIVTLSVIGFWRAGRFRPDGLTLLIAGLGGWLLLESIKWLFQRPRPEAGVLVVTGYSFPSGHAYLSLTLYSLLAHLLSRGASRKRRAISLGAAIAGALLIGSSRVLLGVHYPSDVLAGFAAAIPWLWGCLALSRFFASPSNASTLSGERLATDCSQKPPQATKEQG